jgi:peptidoglycan-associated lipoprotein
MKGSRHWNGPERSGPFLFLALLVLAGCAAPAGAPSSPSSPSSPGYVGALQLAPSVDRGDAAPALRRPGTAADFAQRVPGTILFAYDSPLLTDDARAMLEAQAAWLRTYPEPGIIVEGHADERGNQFYNLELGLQRAQAVRAFLGARGVHPSRIRVVSFGAERPAVPGDDEAAWARNRRAVTLVLD